MSQVSFTTHGDALKHAHKAVLSGDPAVEWAVFTYDKGSTDIKVQSTGDGGLEELSEEFIDGRIQYAFVRVLDPNSKLNKFILIGWCGSGVPVSRKGYFASHLEAVSHFLTGYHLQINARAESDVSPEYILKRLNESGGSKYSVHNEPAQRMQRPDKLQSAYVPTTVDMASLKTGPGASTSSTPGPSGPSAASIARKREEDEKRAKEEERRAKEAEQKKKEDEQRMREAGQQKREADQREEEERREREEQERRERNEQERKNLEAKERKVQEEKERRIKEDEERTKKAKAEKEKKEEEERQRKKKEQAEAEAAQKREDVELTKAKEDMSSAMDALSFQTGVEKPSTFSHTHAIALFDYDAEEKGEISFKEDQVLEVHAMDEGGWWKGSLGGSSTVGLFPANYVRLVDDPKEGGLQAIAQYDYQAAADDELSFEDGDVIINIEKDTDEWWKGTRERDGKSGMFPANYVNLE